jgi:hypothetical protein
MIASILTALTISFAASKPALAPQKPIAATTATLPITVVVMDSFGNDRLLGAVRRTVGKNAQNLVVIKRSELRPEFLVALAKAEAASVKRHGAVPLHPVNMYFMRHRKFPEITQAQRAWATDVIAQLQLAPTKDFGRLGMQRSVTTKF